MAALDLKDFAVKATVEPLAVTKAEAKTLEGTAPLVVDGGVPAIASRVLLKNQTAPEQNGLFEPTSNQSFGGEGNFGGSGNFGVGEGWKLQRTADADTTAEVTKGMLVPVETGAINANTSWVQLTESPIEVGTTPQTFAAFTAIPVGPAGGDLAGTYANPTVVAGGTNSFN